MTIEQIPATSGGHYAVTWKREISPGQSPFNEAWYIHGMLEDERTWKGLHERLGPRSSVRPQFPWSSRLGSSWGREAAGPDWIKRFFDAQTVRPDLIVCHSYGCNATLEYLLRHEAHQPDFLVLVAPFYAARSEDVRWDNLTDFISGLEHLIAESISVQDARGRYKGDLLKEMTAKIRDRLGVYGWFEFLSLYLASPDLPLRRLRSRTLVVSGQLDRYSPSAACEQLAAALPRAEHLVLEAGHFMQETHSETLAEAIVKFAVTPIQKVAL